MKKIDYKKMDRFICSNLPDGVFGIKTEKDVDIILESDSKQNTMKPIRDAFEGIKK
jgi:hypothetical protein